MNTREAMEYTSTDNIISSGESGYPTGFVLESPSSSESPYLPTTQPLTPYKKEHDLRRDKHWNSNVHNQLATVPKETRVSIASNRRTSDTKINIISNESVENSVFTPFLGQSGKDLNSVRVHNDTKKGKTMSMKKPAETCYRPANGHTVKRQQKCADIRRAVTNSYRRCTICLYVLAALTTVAAIALWILTCTNIYSTDYNVLAWSVTMAAASLIVIAVFSDIRERRHREEVDELHRELGRVNRCIYVGSNSHSLGLTNSEKSLKNSLHV